MPAHRYSVNLQNQLMRDDLVLADDVEDLQLAYFFDSVTADNEVDSDALEYPGTVDGNVYASTDWDNSELREIRFSFVVRTRLTDPNLPGAVPQPLENHVPAAVADGFRRRVLTGHGAPAKRGPPPRGRLLMGASMGRMAARHRRQAGSALFVAVMMLVLMGFLGLAALDRVTRDEQVAGFQNRARTAFYAAEAGIAAGAQHRRRLEPIFDRSTTPAFPDDTAPQTVGDTALYDREEGNLPRYYGDPSTGQPPIHWAKDGKKGGAYGMNLQEAGGGLQETLWLINVVGESPDGSRSRLEVLAVRLMAYGYQ